MRWSSLVLAPLVLAACRTTEPTPPGPVFTIEGAVAHPGEKRWNEDLTAIEALALAGPFTADADLAHVELQRASQRTRLDLARAYDGGDSTFNVLVQPGDVLRVPTH